MHLIFLPLMVLPAIAEVTCSWEVIDMGSKTCHNSHRISKTTVDLDSCKSNCENDDDCIQILWQSAAQLGKNDPKCNTFRACTSERSLSNAGTNYILTCEEVGFLDVPALLQTALDTTGCTSGMWNADAATDTSAWQDLYEDFNTRELFEDMYDTCSRTKMGAASRDEQVQCCGEAAVEVHEDSVAMGGVVIETCGPKASQIPFVWTSVSSNPPECKQLYNFPCEAFTYQERMARALIATGCPNKNPDMDLINSWIGKKTDTQLWGALQDYCEVTQKLIGGEGSSLLKRGRDFCCGEGETCMPEHCTTQTSWDCGEPSCPIMKDTKLNANGIATFVGETLSSCQNLCQLHSECMSWTYQDSSTMCYLYDDTVSTSSRSAYTGRHSGYKCKQTYNCVQGQGKSLASYAKYDLNTEAECAAKCFEESGTGVYGQHDKRTYSCVPGQGKSGGSSSSHNLNNRDLCAEKCTTTSNCIGFDFTNNSQGDSCRLYSSTSDARVGNEGSDDREWCYRVTQPCVAFDFTETGTNSACRLYRTTSNARLGDPGNDDRLWCTEHTGGFLPEAEYECKPGTLDSQVWRYYKSTETPLECARRCSLDHACIGFDFSYLTNVQNCRLFHFDLDDMQMSNNPGDWRYCMRKTFSERANNMCDGLDEESCEEANECRFMDGACTLEDTIWCRNGRISDNTSLWSKYFENYTGLTSAQCWEKCKDTPHCFAYEHKGSTCYLHDTWNVIGTYSRYVYDPGCEDSSDDGFGCDDAIPEDDGWKYCRRIASSDIDWYYSSSQQWWAPSRP